MEQHSHLATAMSAPMPRQSPTALSEQLQQREVARLLHALTRLRVAMAPLATVFLGVVVLFDPNTWKIWALSAVALMMIAIAAFDLFRWRREPAELLVWATLDIGLGLVLQTAVIALTGGIESPLVVVYVPLSMVAGITLGAGRSRWVIIAFGSLALWTMTIAGLYGWRTTPAFLHLGDGFAGRPIYSLTTAGVIQMAMIIASSIGVIFRGGIARALASAASARQQALEGLADRNRELVHLSSAIAHELKNPLASIKGLVQLVQRGGKNAEARFEMLEREIDRMRDTLDEFLNFSRPLGDLNIETLDLLPLVDELVALHEGVADARSVTIERPTVASPGDPSGRRDAFAGDVRVRGDARKIKQALSNLLHNAVEASPPGSHVRWRIALDADAVRISLCDEGQGLHPSVRMRATEAGVTTKPDGSGIGLAVARAIAEQHGGTLELTDAPGGGPGCEATLALPMAGADDDEANKESADGAR
ncbi:MAG: HAMP domain-containing histidine kinase [Myxococcales bacterium]|nr:HAMP domain-containing histidine kinase [Myxococcales bacterium]